VQKVLLRYEFLKIKTIFNTFSTKFYFLYLTNELNHAVILGYSVVVDGYTLVCGVYSVVKEKK